MDNASQLISFIDLTSLNSNDTDEVIKQLCQQAVTPKGKVAAVCIYPQFVRLAKDLVKNLDIKVATVANFPAGDTPINIVATAIEQALQDGADEIDVVIPYQDCLAGNYKTSEALIQTCRQLCRDHTLKVIIESGELKSESLIYEVSSRVLEKGADFIKTSTGKVTIGATIDAAKTMLRAIKSVNPNAGFKASGGVRTPDQAQAYVNLAKELLGEKWCTPNHFRIGASSLLNALLVHP